MGEISYIMFSEETPISLGVILTPLIISLCLSIAFYVLRSIGIYALAKKQNIKGAYLSWIPFVWVYVLCKLIKDTMIFGFSFDKIALIFCIVFTVGEVLSLAYNVILYLPYVSLFLLGGSIKINLDTGIISTSGLNIPANYPTTRHPLMIAMQSISSVLELVSLIILITAYINLFRKYMPQHYILAAVLSAFGLFPIFAFVIRKKSAVNYADYLRTRYGTPYNDPYGNPYNNPNNNLNPNNYPPETPFSEFAERGEIDPDDPFSDFSDKK